MDKLQLQFEDCFWKEEIRDGYIVSGQTKKIWAVELDLMNIFMNVCRKHNIQFIAFAGTLLGAIRHRGFIPWDDDFDVAMDRENFNKLLKVASEEFMYPYFLQTALSDRKFFTGYARLRNSNTTGIIAWTKDKEYNNGIYIDIYVLDGYVNEPRKLKWQLLKRDFWSRLACSYYCDYRQKSMVKKLGIIVLRHSIAKFVSYEVIIKKYNDCLKSYTNDTDKLSLLTHDNKVISKYWCLKNDLKEVEYVPFENIIVPIPKNYDKVLRHMYGEYMEFPPLEKRGKWHEGTIIFDPDISYKEYFDKFFSDI